MRVEVDVATRNIARDKSAEDELAWSIMNEATSSPVEIRRLWPSDKEAFRDHLLSLGPRSRHLRCGGGMSDDFLIRYAKIASAKATLSTGRLSMASWSARR